MDHTFPISLQCQFFHLLSLYMYICLHLSVSSLFFSINLFIYFCIILMIYESIMRILVLITDRAGFSSLSLSDFFLAVPRCLLFSRNFRINLFSFVPQNFLLGL